MKNSNANLCIRCGKVRISGKSWKEKVPSGIIVHTAFVCPDKACQKIVDSQLLRVKDKREALEEEKIQRTIASKIAPQS